MLRIAQCNDSFLPVMDGVGRVAYQYASALGGRGHDCYVVTPMTNTGCRGKYTFEIVDYMGMPLPRSPQYHAGVAALDTHYMARMETVKVDLVHAHSPGPAGLEAIRLAVKQKVPLIGTFHSKYHEDILRVTRSEGLTAIGVRYVADFFDRCDEVWTVSRAAAQTLRSYGYRGRIEIVHNGTDIPVISDADVRLAREVFLLGEKPILLYVGQMDWKKNLKLTLHAAAQLQSRDVEFQLVMAGQGKDEKAVRKLTEELGLMGRTTFTGHITDPCLLNGLYAAASLFVFPSAYDTAGLVVRESAAAGTPSIVLANTAPAEVVHDGENGFVCEDSPDSLSRILERALSDQAGLKRIGERARKTIPIPWETVMNDVIDRYQALVDTERVALKRKRGLFRKELTAVDKSLEKRMLDMVWRFVKQDMQHIYSYGYTLQKAQPRLMLGEGVKGEPLPRSTPEEQGMRSADLLALYHSVDADIDARVQGMLVMRHGHVIAEGYWAPYERELPHQLYSLSKSVTATAIGMLVDEGKLSLDERVIDLFADKISNPYSHSLKEITVWHLLTMSSGVRFDEAGTALGADWEQEFLDSGVRFHAGSQFYYNSLNTYMLAAIVRRKTGQGLVDYLRPRLFAPLGIAAVNWETCPMGIEKGGWGLSLTLEDVAKIGQLYLQKGRWMINGEKKQLLSEEWVEDATRVQIDTPNGECRDGYGYQVWIAPTPGGFLFNGAFGQYMLALPHVDAVVAVFSGTSRLFAQGALMSYVNRAFLNAADHPLHQQNAAYRSFRDVLAGLSCQGRQNIAFEGALSMPFHWIRSQLDGETYMFERNIGGLFPVVIQSVHNNYTTGLTRIDFAAQEDGTLAVTFIEGETQNAIIVQGDAFTRGSVTMREETHTVSVSARCGITAAGEALLRLYVYFLETPCTRILTFRFKDGGVSLNCDEDPSVQNAAAMLMELTGITKMELFRGLMPLLKRESLQTHLRTFTTDNARGTKL